MPDPESQPPPAPEAAAPAPPPSPAAAPTLPGATVDQIASAVIEAAPTPTAESDAGAGAGPRVESKWAALRDRNGNAFNPELHLTNPDGSPKLTPAGRLWGKPGVVLPRQDATAPAKVSRSLDLSAAGGQVSAADDDEEDEDDDDLVDDEEGPEIHRAGDPEKPLPTQAPAVLTEEERKRLAKDTAEVAVQLLQALGKFVAGKDGAFQKNEEAGDEYGDLKKSYTAWFETMENLVHISPGWIVAVNTGRYMSRCASTETGQRRIEKGTRWAGSAWSKVRLMWHTWRATAKK